MTASVPDNEKARLGALGEYAVLDTPPEAAFDDLVRLAAHLCQAPTALVSLIDGDRQWFKARVGLDVCQTPRDQSFCAHAILRPDVLVVPDTHLDPRFADNPLVTGAPHIRFYAGAPLVTPSGQALGTLCVIDYVPRTLSAEQKAALEIVARQVVTQLELRRSLAERTQTEARLSAIVAHTLDAIITIDHAQQVVEWNPAAEQIFGYTPAEAIKRNLSALIVSPTEPGAAPGRRLEVPAVHKNGHALTVELVTTPIPGFDRGLFAVCVRDISLAKAAETALRDSEARLRAVADCLGEGLLLTDLDDIVLFVNERTAEITGYPASEMIGRPAYELLLLPDQWPDLRSRNQERGQGKSERYEKQLRRKNGTMFWADNNATPFRDANNNVVGTLCALTDISERKATEQALLESEERYRLLADNIDDVVSLHDAKGRYLYVSPSVERLTGHAPSEHIGHEAYAFMHQDDHARLALDAYKPSQKGVTTVIEWRRRCKNGTFLWMETRTRALPSKNGALPHLLCSTRDVSERKAAEAEREQLLCALEGAKSDLERRVAARTGELAHANRALENELAEKKRAENEIRGLNAQLERRIGRIAALRKIDRAITAGVDLPATLDIFLRVLIEQLNVDAARVLLINADATLEPAAAHARCGGTAAAAALPPLSAPATLRELQTALKTGARRAAIENAGFAGYHLVPFASNGQLGGVVEVFNRCPLAPSAEWLDFLETLAGQAAIAVDNARLVRGLTSANDELRRAYDATIEGWSRALDLRDKETEGHSRRVTDMTIRLARAVGITNQDQLTQIRRGALLHDIGKMGVPDAILNKPGPLTNDEWEVMRRHPQHAFEMLSPIAFLRPALEIPHCHHEKWDGSGYPRGLSGEAIPLAARLFALVDVWDALRSDRPYRAGWPADKVRAYLREQAGTHFDPHLAAVFLGLLEEERDLAKAA